MGARQDQDDPRYDVPAMVLAVGVPVLAAASFVGAGFWWAEELGDRVVTTWGAGGEPQGEDSRVAFLVGYGVMVLVLPLALGLAAGFGRVWVSLRRSLLGFGVGLALFCGLLGLVGLAVQLDGEPGRLTVWTVLGLGALAALAGVGASRVPRDRRPVVLATAAPDPALPRSAATQVPSHRIGMGGRLRVEDGVVRVRWPVGEAVAVPVAEVTGARVITVSGFGEYGGWGLRMHPMGGTYAFIGSGSSAVELTKADGSRWVVTTPRAEEVAGAVNAAADLLHAARPA